MMIGAGSFGRVYKGRWGGRDVAVKVIEHESASAVENEVGPPKQDAPAHARYNSLHCLPSCWRILPQMQRTAGAATYVMCCWELNCLPRFASIGTNAAAAGSIAPAAADPLICLCCRAGAADAVHQPHQRGRCCRHELIKGQQQCTHAVLSVAIREAVYAYRHAAFAGIPAGLQYDLLGVTAPPTCFCRIPHAGTMPMQFEAEPGVCTIMLTLHVTVE